MPTYSYKCNSCEHQFDVMQGINDERLKTCPECNKDKLERLIGAGAGIIFKGTGFYQTDYKNTGSKGSGAPKKEGGKSSTEKK